jgi:REP element-mobilizing transposase RayT
VLFVLVRNRSRVTSTAALSTPRLFLVQRGILIYAEGVTHHSPGLPRSGYPGRRTVDNLGPSPLRFSDDAQSLSNVLVHIVFSTKERHPFLLDTKLRAGMHKHLAAVSTQLRCPVIKVGGVEDHVHILARQARTIRLAEWVKEIKRTSSLWVKEARQGCYVFQWQAGYGRARTPFP